MSYLQTFQIFPAIPDDFSFIQVLGRNLWWSWNIDAIELFRRINPKLWNQSGHNPIFFSTLVPQAQLEKLTKDESFRAHQERVKKSFVSEILAPVDHTEQPYGKDGTIAYFSMEFGIHESLPLFAGGLGVLSGDHLKAASDLELPLIGVGLLFREGYFHQFLDQNGWQQEAYPETELFHLPLKRAKDRSGKEIIVTVTGQNGDIRAAVWKIMVGRIPLYLLDTNLPENSPDVRKITSRLYAGDAAIRLAQEVLLGIGGMKALAALEINVKVSHMNEGHCAFVNLERLAQTVATHKVDYQTAIEIVTRSSVFTTHTPVAAGHDEFPVELVKPYLVPLAEMLNTDFETVLSWGQPAGAEADAPLSMFVLALRMAQYCNGVSKLHGKTARRMWSHVWPGRPEDEIPIIHITNGVHIASWISRENAQLFEQYLGPEWYLNVWNKEISNRIQDIYDEELWRAHEMSRSRLIRFCREMMVRQYGRRNAPKSTMDQAGSVLEQDALTIAFSRRFATYKRADLLLKDPERFEAIINSKTRPVQFVFSGKAHPKDNEGKELIQRIIKFARRANVRHKLIFIEDYDINVARHLVQGADVWLNTPRRPFEACGTSGIKAAANGVLNVSVLDGWWCEGYAEDRGWSIGKGEEYTDPVYQDEVESQALYNVLENDVIPCFYERDHGDLPDRWLKMMKASMKMAIQQFGAHIMVDHYEKYFYLPAAERYGGLMANNAEDAGKFAVQLQRLKKLWKGIKIQVPVRDMEGPFKVGESFAVTSVVNLGELHPDEVSVELYYGKLKSVDVIIDSNVEKMTVKEDRGHGEYLYACTLPCKISGRFGFTVRATPAGDDRIQYVPGLITWVSQEEIGLENNDLQI